MAGEGFRIAPEALVTHAGRVQQVADSVATAKGAGNAASKSAGLRVAFSNRRGLLPSTTAAPLIGDIRGIGR